jgi:hypothetical protein
VVLTLTEKKKALEDLAATDTPATIHISTSARSARWLKVFLSTTSIITRKLRTVQLGFLGMKLAIGYSALCATKINKKNKKIFEKRLKNSLQNR